MIPREAGRGRSFLGAGQYYLQDKRAETSERVEFTHTENVPTNDPEKALKWMAFTAIHADDLKRESGARVTSHFCGKPVYTFSLAWHPEQDPNKHEMVGAGRTALEALGLEKHEALMVSHTDRAHPHMHVIVNVVDPETGKANRLSYSKTKLSDWAENYERENGKIYCDQRVENNAKRQQGEYVKYREPEVDLKTQISELYRQSDSGAAFQAGLSEMGYTLAQGKRIVLIDREGKIHSLYRQIEGVKAAEVKDRLTDVELSDVDDARGQVESAGGVAKTEQGHSSAKEEADIKKTDNKPEQAQEIFDRDQQDREWQESIIDAAIANDTATRKRPPPRAEARPQLSQAQLNALQDRHHAELGRFYSENVRARRQLEHRLDQEYGKYDRQLRSDISKLEDTLENSGRFRMWWLRTTGRIPHNADQHLKEMRASLENVEWRKAEAEQALENDVAATREAIEARQLQERELATTNAPPDLEPYGEPDMDQDLARDDPMLEY